MDHAPRLITLLDKKPELYELLKKVTQKKEQQQVQVNQMTENKPVNQSLFYQNSIQSMQANQIIGNSPGNFINVFHPVQQLQTNQIAGNNSLRKRLDRAQEIAKLQTAIFDFNS